MPAPVRQVKITCTSCRHTEIWGLESTIRHLIKAGKMKRTASLEPTIIFELIFALGSTLRCGECGHQGLAAVPFEDDATAFDDQDGWLDARLCEACGNEIPGERIAAVANVKLCVACQTRLDAGGDPGGAQVYCPRCGSPMKIQPVHGDGTTRYAMSCTTPNCRGRIM